MFLGTHLKDESQTLAFMIAGNGDTAGSSVSFLNSGADDGFLGIHSTCGGNKYGSFGSCVGYMAPNGKVNDS